MLPSIDVVKENKSAWNNVYAGSPRLRYPDNMFVHFLMRYAPWKQMQRGICIGAGDGADAFACAQLGIAMTCADISEESVARLQKFAADDGLEKLVTAQLADQRKLTGVNDNTYDLAISWSVISYGTKADGEKAIGEIHRVLKPGGSFIGILESIEHTGYLQDGVTHVEGRTFQMPKWDNQTKADLVMTYYDRDEVDHALRNFTDISISHRLFHLPPDAKRKVGQWMFHAKKK